MDLSALIFAALKSAKTANERIDNLPDLPSNANIGDTYFVATAGTYDGISARVGDMFFYNNSSTWSYIPTGDVDTWRNVFVNGTEVQGIDNKDALKFVDSDSVKVNYDGVNKAVSFAGLKVKSFTYTGNGQSTNIITFPTLPKVILSIYGRYNFVDGEYVGQAWLSTTIWGAQPMGSTHNGAGNGVGVNVSEWAVALKFDDNAKTMTITGNNTYISLNNNNFEYIVTYI